MKVEQLDDGAIVLKRKREEKEEENVERRIQKIPHNSSVMMERQKQIIRTETEDAIAAVEKKVEEEEARKTAASQMSTQQLELVQTGMGLMEVYAKSSLRVEELIRKRKDYIESIEMARREHDFLYFMIFPPHNAVLTLEKRYKVLISMGERYISKSFVRQAGHQLNRLFDKFVTYMGMDAIDDVRRIILPENISVEAWANAVDDYKRKKSVSYPDVPVPSIYLDWEDIDKLFNFVCSDKDGHCIYADYPSVLKKNAEDIMLCCFMMCDDEFFRYHATTDRPFMKFLYPDRTRTFLFGNSSSSRSEPSVFNMLEALADQRSLTPGGPRITEEAFLAKIRGFPIEIDYYKPFLDGRETVYTGGRTKYLHYEQM